MVLHVGMSLRVCIAAVPAAVTFPYHGDSQGVAGWAPPFGQPPSRQDLVPPSRDQWALRTADEARRAAELYLGALLERSEQGDAAAPAPEIRLVTVTQDHGPFVLAETDVWHATFLEVNLQLPTREDGVAAEPRQAAGRRRLEVFLDPVTGKLRRAELLNEELDVEAPPEPGGRAFKHQLWGAGQESWVGLPDDRPATPLLAALASIENDMGGVTSAKKIVVHYVDWRMGPLTRLPGPEGRRANDWRPAWCIDLRGIPPVDGGDIHDNARNHLRHVVDARSGKWIMASSVPQPEAPEEAAVSPKPAAAPRDG